MNFVFVFLELILTYVSLKRGCGSRAEAQVWEVLINFYNLN